MSRDAAAARCKSLLNSNELCARLVRAALQRSSQRKTKGDEESVQRATGRPKATRTPPPPRTAEGLRLLEREVDCVALEVHPHASNLGASQGCARVAVHVGKSSPPRVRRTRWVPKPPFSPSRAAAKGSQLLPLRHCCFNHQPCRGSPPARPRRPTAARAAAATAAAAVRKKKAPKSVQPPAPHDDE